MLKALLARLAFAGLALASASIAPALAQDTIKIGYIDPLSGTFAQSGDQFLKVFRYVIDGINAPAARSARSSSWWRSTTRRSRPRR